MWWYLKKDAINETHKNNEINLITRLNIFLAIAEGAYEIQDAGLTHGDMKLNNVLISLDPGFKLKDLYGNQSSVVITDFGQAKQISEVTSDTTACGTPAFTAPEQIRNQRFKQTDNYAVGIILAALVMDWRTFWCAMFLGQDDEEEIEKFVTQSPFHSRICKIISGLIHVSLE